jgi:FkbM family methyltransferase
VLRNAKFLRYALRVSPKTVVHVGADKGQDRAAYLQMGAKRIIWGEADPALAEALRQKYPGDLVVSGLFWDVPECSEPFYLTTSPSQNSAIKPLLESDVSIESEITLLTTNLDTVFTDQYFPQPLMLVVDVQGAEDRVLAGGKNFLKETQLAVIEIALKSQGYASMPSEASIDEIMFLHGFKKSIYRQGKNGTYKDQLYFRGTNFTVRTVSFLDFLFDFIMRIRHGLLTGHKMKIHYHCEKCNF